jgi:peptide/nickel transport system substrate-binding protein
MKRQSAILLAALGLAAALALSACNGSGQPGPQHTSAAYDTALRAVVNPSAHRGGTIIFDNSASPDSTDPGNTYYAYTWDTARLYTRTLVTYKSAPGAAGLQLVPDLATTLGTVSDHGLAWPTTSSPASSSKTAP